MTNARISPKAKAILQLNDGTAVAITEAIVKEGNKLSSKEGLKVTVNGRSYILRNAPRRSAE